MMQVKKLIPPKVYQVGVDLEADRYQEALVKIADWYAESRKTKEPALLAKQQLECCLNGVTMEGTPWYSAWNSSLVTRIKMMCRFDIDKMEPIRKGNEKTRRKKQKDKERRQRKRKKLADDKLMPDEIRAELRKKATYGEDANVMMTSEEERVWQGTYEDYQAAFPELRSINAEAELKLLCDLHLLSERHRMKLLKGQPVDIVERSAVAEQLQRLKKSLGIHPDQLSKRVKSREDTSIGAAAARLEAMGNYRELREKFWVEELLQIWQAYMTPTADGLSYQLDEVGLFGLTRSLPSDCPRCGQRVFAGLKIDEIEEWLIEKGVLTRVDGDNSEKMVAENAIAT